MKSVPKSRMKSVVVAAIPESHESTSISNEPGGGNSINPNPKSHHSENGNQNAEPVASAVSTLDDGAGKGTESPSAARAKIDNNNVSEQEPVSSSGLQENIVLGVALDGGKRTLPIEEVVAPSSPGKKDTA
ncbi:hypothetical protein MLD38_028765 [Melastoma candidum]|nr:hypothetical protein MLD38_028765 [Melastoma candidum]